MTSSLRKLSIRVRLRLALARVGADPQARAADPERQHVFVLLAADYGNLGDLAITHAQTRFLEAQFPSAVVEAIPISRTLPAIKRLRRVIQDQDVVTIIGGGNTGDMYDDIQYLRELAISSFPRNQIISFPQTVEFSDTRYGRWAQRRAAKVYNDHPHLTVMARDSRSAAVARGLFAECQVLQAPDVVLTLDDQASSSGPRDGVLVALRSDLERGLSATDRAALLSAASGVGRATERDTHIGDVRLSAAQALHELSDFWAQCRSSRLILTDRLHGVIFGVITGTPVLAFDSGTGKVGQFYRDWLQDVPGVRLVDRVEAGDLPEELTTVVPSGSGLGLAAVRTRFAAAFEEARGSWGAVP